MRYATVIPAAFVLTTMTACTAPQRANRFGDDLAFLRRHTDVVVLSDAGGSAQLAIAPAYQGRSFGTQLFRGHLT